MWASIQVSRLAMVSSTTRVPSAVMPFVIVGMALGALVVLVGLTAVVTQD